MKADRLPVESLPGIELATWRSATHISPGARSVGCAGQLKRWATDWSVAWESGQVGSLSQPSG